MQRKTRAMLLATVVSPLMVIPVTFLVAGLTWVGGWIKGTPEEIGGIAAAFVVTSMFGLVVAYGCMAIFGAPLALIALRVRRASYPVALTVGVVCALLVWWLLKHNSPDLRSALSMASYGLAVSAAFVAAFRRLTSAAGG